LIMSEMTVSMIAAVAANKVIGKDNDLIWHLPLDMKFFKDSTKGHHVLMGRRNYESIPEKYRPLPGRPNIVITRQTDYHAPGAIVVNSIEEGLEIARKNGEEEAFIIGGGMIYAMALEKDLADMMYLTVLDKEYEGDTWFPEVKGDDWVITDEIRFDADEKHETGFVITTLVRAKS